MNNAGIWRYHSILDMTPDDARAVNEVNVFGIIWCTQAFVPKMTRRRRGNHREHVLRRGVDELARASACTRPPSPRSSR